jgi:nucleotide-binding universal stress UspA family protein
LDATQTRSPLTVLLAVDGSSYSDAEATLVAGIAWPAGTAVRVLAVMRGPLPLVGLSPETQRMVDESLSDLRQQEWAVAETLTTQVANRLRAHDLVVEVLVREGRPAEVILEQAVAMSADLIVIGAKGLSAPDEFRLGATAHKLAHYADCAVLVVRPPERAQLLSAILASDGSPEAQRAAEFLCALSLPRWTEVTVVSVAEAKGGHPAWRQPARIPATDSVRRACAEHGPLWTPGRRNPSRCTRAGCRSDRRRRARPDSSRPLSDGRCSPESCKVCFLFGVGGALEVTRSLRRRAA